MGAEASTSATGADEPESALHARLAAAAEHPTWVAAPADGIPPSARECVGVAASGGAHVFVVAGRGAETAHNDVAMYDVAAGRWLPVSPAGSAPAARSGHAAVLVPDVGVLVHGGLGDETGFLSDSVLLRFCPGGGALKWTPLALTGDKPSARDKHTAVMCPPAGARTSCGDSRSWRMITFGGFGVLPDGAAAEAGEEESEEEDAGEEEEEEAGEEAAAGDGGVGEQTGRGEPSLADRLRAVAAAKAKSERATRAAREPALKLGWFNDAHQLEFDGPGRWGKLECDQPKTERPAGRAAHGACWFGGEPGEDGAAAHGAAMLVFGGRTAEGRTNDLWLLDVDSGRWRSPACAGRPPCARSWHSVTKLVSPVRKVPLAAVFGGLDSHSRHLDDLHLLASEGMAWARVPTQPGPAASPAGRGCAAVVAVSGSALLVFGGSSCWDDQQGGATAFHKDLHTIDLAALLAATIDEQAPEAAAGEAATKAGEHSLSELGGAPAKKAKLAEAEGALAEGAPTPAAVLGSEQQ